MPAEGGEPAAVSVSVQARVRVRVRVRLRVPVRVKVRVRVKVKVRVRAEPLPTASPLWLHPKVTVTPHNAAVTQPEDVARAFAANLARFEQAIALPRP